MGAVINELYKVVCERQKWFDKYNRFLSKLSNKMNKHYVEEHGSDEAWTEYLNEVGYENKRKYYNVKDDELCAEIQKVWKKIFHKRNNITEKWIIDNFREKEAISTIEDMFDAGYAIFEVVRETPYTDEPNQWKLRAVAHGLLELDKYLEKNKRASRPTKLKIIMESDKVWVM